MVINRCKFNRRTLSECFGDAALEALGSRIIVSSGAIMGTRSGIILWSHHMTMVGDNFSLPERFWCREYITPKICMCTCHPFTLFWAQMFIALIICAVEA